MTKKKEDDALLKDDWSKLPIMICAHCKSTDWLQRPSGGIICRICGAPAHESVEKPDRP